MKSAANTVSLPAGSSLRRVAQVLLDAWEVGSHQWRGTPLQLREGGEIPWPAPVPQDAVALFQTLHERGTSYLLVGGMALLTYLQGRNTKDVDLLMSLQAMRQIPELQIEDRKDCFVRAHFRSVQVDLLLTSNPLFRIVSGRFATRHRFAELDVPTATVEGLIVLKLYALPSLYRQMEMDRIAIYENDITMLLARHAPQTEPMLSLVQSHVGPADAKELETILQECSQRARRMRRRIEPR